MSKLKLTIRIKPKRFVTIDEMIKAGDIIAQSLNDWAVFPGEFIADWEIKPDKTGCSYRFIRADGHVTTRRYNLGELFNILYGADWECYRD